MPHNFNNVDAWELQYIKGLPEAKHFPWTDEDAWNFYPHLRWLYDKLTLSKVFQTPQTWDLITKMPNSYPVVVKPRLNFEGMGCDAYWAWAHDDILPQDYNTHIAQVPVGGLHWSVDVAMDDGKPAHTEAWVAHKDHRSCFWLFSKVFPVPTQVTAVVRPVIDALPNHTGFLNIEFIGHHVIEVHLRSSLQFGDLLDTIPKLFGAPHKSRYRAFSRVYRKFSPDLPTLPSSMSPDPRFHEQSPFPPGVNSVQWCYEPHWKSLHETAQDGISFRYLVINGTDFQAVEKHGALLSSYQTT